MHVSCTVHALTGSCVQVTDTYDVDAARQSYYGQLFPLNPSGIIPTGPSAADLRLGVDPSRGPLSRDVVFLKTTQKAAA